MKFIYIAIVSASVIGVVWICWNRESTKAVIRAGFSASTHTTVVQGARHIKITKEPEVFSQLTATEGSSEQEVALDRVEGLLERGNIELATTILREHLTKYPGDSKAWERLGTILKFRRNLPSEAIDAFRNALDANPQNTVALGEFLDSLNKSPDPAREKIFIENLARSCPDCGDAAIAAGEFAIEQRSFDDAVSFFEGAAQKPGTKEVALRKLYELHRKMGNYAQAEEALSAAVAIADQYYRQLLEQHVSADAVKRNLESDRKILNELRVLAQRRSG